MGDRDDDDDDETRKYVVVHFGPYFRCASLPKLGTKTITTCANPECELHDADKFWMESHVHCHGCGGKLVRKDVPDESLRRDSWKLSKHVGHEICPCFYHWRKDCDIWLPGTQGIFPKAPRGFSLDDPPQVVPITDGAQVEAEKAWLLYTRAPNAYRRLCEVYGSENVTLEWGVVLWEYTA